MAADAHFGLVTSLRTKKLIKCMFDINSVNVKPVTELSIIQQGKGHVVEVNNMQ
jgi:hypothetical protein